jgi:prepilin-type N-terminal cleavage/methylation domain-containing protein
MAKSIFKYSPPIQKTMGFTLVELSIVIVVIGLVVAAVTAGRSIVNGAQLRSIITDFNKYSLAVNTFKLQYGGLPGDIINANSYWGTAVNGNGNRFIIESSNEDLQAWHQLAKAQIIPGSYTGAVINGGVHAGLGVNVPISSKSTAGFILATSYVYSRMTKYGNANYLRLASPDAASGYYMYGGRALTAPDAYALDLKVDDGLADQGRYSVVRDYTLGSGCVANAWDAATSGSFTLTDSTTIACTVYYWY